ILFDMGYIINTTSGLLNTTLTDIGRRDIARGGFEIKYFGIGDSEIDYDGVVKDLRILQPPILTNSNADQQSLKYPFRRTNGEFYVVGLPDNKLSSVYNTAPPRVFFSGDSFGYSAIMSSRYVVGADFY